MNETGEPRQLGTSALALVLWLLTFGLGLQCVYDLLQIYYLVNGMLGGNMVQAERFGMGVVFILAVGMLVFVIGSTEYHMKHLGKPESWRLFARSLAVEVSIIVLYYIL